MFDALQDHRLSGAVDPADRAPIAVPDPVLVAAERSSRGMCREGVGGETLDFDEKRPPVACRQSREILGGTRRNDQPHTGIIVGDDQVVKVIVAVSDIAWAHGLTIPPSILACADEVVE